MIKETTIQAEKELSDEEIIKAIHEYVLNEEKDGRSSGYDASPCYTVKELAKKLDTSVHTVRFYDKEHLFPYVQRTNSNERLFSEADYAYGKMILCLRGLGLSIHDCRLFILDTMIGDETANERLKILLALQERLEEQIAELNESLMDLQFKIRYYSHLDEIVETEKEEGSFKDKHRGTMYNLHQFVLKQKNITKK